MFSDNITLSHAFPRHHRRGLIEAYLAAPPPVSPLPLPFPGIIAGASLKRP